ncbi:MAG: hypothetical protein MHM6MM_008823 [Cercozoa sp. M6MM]
MQFLMAQCNSVSIEDLADMLCSREEECNVFATSAISAAGNTRSGEPNSKQLSSRDSIESHESTTSVLQSIKVDACAEAFKILDPRSHGRVDTDALADLFARMGLRLDSADWKAVRSVADLDRDGHISLSDFIRLGEIDEGTVEASFDREPGR